MKTLYGIWCKDANRGDGDWFRETTADCDSGLIAFPSRTAAQRRAARMYGYATYGAAKRDDWCEVRPLFADVGAGLTSENSRRRAASRKVMKRTVMK